MTWKIPKTWVANSRLNDVDLNADLRDNMMETMPAKALSADKFFVSEGLNKIGMREILMSYSSVTATINSGTSLYRFASSGPDVTITTGIMALCIWGSMINGQTTTFAYHSVSPIVPAGYTYYWDSQMDTWALHYGASRIAAHPFRAMSFKLFTGLTPGLNTFRSLYRYDGSGTATWVNRYLIVIAL